MVSSYSLISAQSNVFVLSVVGCPEEDVGELPYGKLALFYYH